MKKYLTIFLSVILSMIASTASSYDFYDAHLYYNITSSTPPLTVEVTKTPKPSGSEYSAYSDKITIPESVTYGGRLYSVTSIGKEAFYRSKVTSVTIPNTVTSIGDDAFSRCQYQFSINIPNSVTRIGESAFAYSPINSINIPNSVTSIGKSAFSGCSGLKKVIIQDIAAWCGFSFNDADNPLFYAGHLYSNEETEITDLIIPNGVSNIGASVFSGCLGLTSVTIPNSVTKIDASAFKGCSGLTSVTIPNSVTSIGASAFADSKLNSVTIGSGVLSIGGGAFPSISGKPKKVIWLTNTPPSDYINAEGIINYVANDLYTSLHNKIVYPFLSSIFDVEGIKYVPVSPSERTCDAIDCCYDTSAVNIHIGKTTSYKGIELQVKNVRPYICYQNSDIKDVLLDFEGDVPEYAFYGCKNLMSATISNRGNVDESAFANASLNGMLTITNDGNIKKSAFSGINGSFQANVNNTGNIAENAFKGSAGMTSLTVNDKVTDLGEQSFYGCTGLSTAAISNQGNIGKSAFAGSKINETLTVNNAGNIETSAFSEISGSFTANVNNTGSIAISAFSKSTGITSLTVSNKVKELGDNSFYGCTGLTTVTISNQGNIGESAFKSSKINGTLTINNLGDIKSSAFRDVIGSFTANINNTGSISTSTFEGASGITALEIGNNVINLGVNAFKSCSELQTAILGDSIVSIGESAFNGCSSLQSINIPNAVTSLGAYAFSECSQMISAKIGTGITAILTHSFSGCSSMTEVQIGPNVQSIGESTFSGCSSLPTIIIPEAVNSIGDYTFGGCRSLNIVIMKEKASELTLGCNGKKPMFVDCPLDSVFIGRNISYPTESNQGYSPFYRNTSLRSIHISDVETEVSPNEFYGCTNLKNVRLGDGITDIGNWAFSGCSSIDFFSFGSNLKNIGKEAFSDCTAMTKLISHSAIPPECGEQALDDINKWNCVLEVPYGSLSAYQSKAQWKEFFFVNEADYCNVTAMSYTREYGDANPSFDFTVEGDIIDGQPEIICEATATSPVGEYPIIIKKGSIKNFNGTLLNGVLTIIKATLSVSVGNYTKKQGEENPEFMLNYSGFKNNETETVLKKKPTATTTATESSAPGEYNIVVNGGEAENYTLSYKNGKLTIIQADAVVITAKSYTREYGDANPTFEYTVEGATLEGQPEIICEATATSPVGEYPIIIRKGNVSNYNDTYINGVLTITKAPLTIGVGKYEKKQYDPMPEFVLNYKGFKNNETNEVLTKQPTVNCEANDNSAPGEYEIIVKDAEAENYEIQYVFGKLVVTEFDSNNIIFADANVKAICIANWDTNGDGELSVKEAAAVKSIGNCFKDNKEISSFNEFRYFTKVAEIGFEAFRGCTLTSITIPGNVKTIDVYAFYDCVCLSSIKVEEGNKVYDSRNECNAIIETETNTLIIGCKNTFIPNSVTTIGSSAFELCIGLTDIIIPNSVKSIESDAFNGCSSLTSIAITNSVKSIGVAAFADCSSLTSIIIPSSVTRIDDYTFRGCTSLRTVIIEGRGNNLSE